MDARKIPSLLLLLCVLLAACHPAIPPSTLPAPGPTPTAILATARHVPLAVAVTEPVLTAVPTTAAAVSRPVTVAFSGAVPAALRAQVSLPDGYTLVEPSQKSSVLLVASAPQPAASDRSAWVYVLAAPFPTLADEVSLSEIQLAWQGKPGKTFSTQPLLVSTSTRAAFEQMWGAAKGQRVKTLPDDQLLGEAWKQPYGWAILPFEQVGPRWKVLRVGGQSPLERDFQAETYPLVVQFQFAPPLKESRIRLPSTNRDPQKLTVLVMTGVTALVREIAEKMEEKGVLYPAGDIRDWLAKADITHISNEVSFDEDCPDPKKRDPNFCSSPRYLELLQDVGTDVVELTGNHLLDRGQEPFLSTLKIYQENGWKVYGGGLNLEQARGAITLEDHGNRLAFIGCNPAGPESNWATEKQAGSAPCDFPWMQAEITRLARAGYLVIATEQHVEVCTMEPHLGQQADFKKLSDAGAVIVSGSQAHCPQGMAFSGDRFIHYGLGNLFFDQMDMFARRQFIDRHVFYDGRYLGTELLTAELEDYARPRPMDASRRQKLLEDAFRASGWIK